MSTAVKELAEKYYPRFWNKARLEALVAADKLTEQEYEEVTGEPFVKEEPDETV